MIMSKLRDGIDKRDRIFEQLTRDIFNETRDTLTVITEYVKSVNKIIGQGKMVWEDLELLEDNLLFVGRVTYDIGKRISITEDTTIVVDENNLIELEVPVTFEVPVNIVEENDIDALRKHLDEVFVSVDFNEDVIDSDYRNSFGVDGAQKMSELHYNNISDFKLDDLTEEQKNALQLTTMTTKTGNN